MALDLVALRNTLENLSITRQLPEPLRQRFVLTLVGVGNNIQASDGEKLFTEGEKSSELAYALLTGTVDVAKSTAPTVTVQAPDLFGEMQQINPDGVRTATVVVRDTATLLRFSWNNFFSLALALFNEQEMVQLRQALEELAWSHVV